MKKSVYHKVVSITSYLILVLVIMIFSVSSVMAGRGSLRISVLPSSELAVSVDFRDESGDKALKKGEKGRIIITVINNGKTESKNVTARIGTDRSIGGLKYANRVKFGNIAGGKIVKKDVPVSVTGDVGKGAVKFSVSVKDSNGFESGPIDVKVGFKAQMKPKLVVHDFGINDMSKNLQIEPRERVILTVRIRNAGAGVARNVNVEIDYGKDVTICGSGITNFDIGEILPGKYEDVKFSFYADKSIKRGERIPIDIKIKESRPEFNSTIPLDIRMNSVVNSSQNLK